MYKNIDINYADIIFDDVANGQGLGAVFFTQYCPWKCNGCQNPDTWSKNGGKLFTNEVLNKLLKYYEDVPFASRLTISGGDPLSNYNLELTDYIIKSFKEKYPNKKVWIYTGYDFDDIVMDANCVVHTEFQYNAKRRLEILRQCDVLVDRKFDINKRDITLQFKGSSNQRLINIPLTLKYDNKVVLWRE